MAFKLAEAFVSVGADTAALRRGISNTKQNLRSMLAPLAGIVGGLFAGLTTAGLFSLGRESLDLAQRQIAAERRLAATIKTTGGVAGFTAKELMAFASELQNVTNVGDEETLELMSLLLTFKAVTGDVFKRATQAAIDLAAVGFGSLTSNAVQLGKALEDPIRGMGALRRSGVSFSESQQETIKGLVRQNKLYEAQVLIMEAVEGQVKDVGGAIVSRATQIDNAIGDMKEEIGRALRPIVVQFKELQLVVSQVVFGSITNFLKLNNVLGGLPSKILLTTGAVVAFGTFIATAVAGLKLLGLTFTAVFVSTGIGAVILGIGAAVFGVVRGMQRLVRWIRTSKDVQTEWNLVLRNFRESWQLVSNAFALVRMQINAGIGRMDNSFTRWIRDMTVSVKAFTIGTALAFSGLVRIIANAFATLLIGWNHVKEVLTSSAAILWIDLEVGAIRFVNRVLDLFRASPFFDLLFGDLEDALMRVDLRVGARLRDELVDLNVAIATLRDIFNDLATAEFTFAKEVEESFKKAEDSAKAASGALKGTFVELPSLIKEFQRLELEGNTDHRIATATEKTAKLMLDVRDAIRDLPSGMPVSMILTAGS